MRARHAVVALLLLAACEKEIEELSTSQLLERTLSFDNPDAQAAARAELVRRSDPEHIRRLVQELEAPNDGERAAAARTILSLPGQKSLRGDNIRSARGRPDATPPPPGRLGETVPPGSARTDGSGCRRRSATRALALRGRNAALSLAMASGFVQDEAGHGERMQGLHSAIEPLIAMLESETVLARANAAAALSFLWSDESFLPDEDTIVPVLIRLLSDDLSQTRFAAAVALTKFGGRAIESEAALLKALGDPDDAVRFGASWALMVIANREEHMGEFAQLLLDPDPRVRSVAADALGEHHKKAAFSVPLLFRLVDDQDDGVRDSVAAALGHIGARPERAVPLALAQMEREEHAWFRDNWIHALGRLAAVAEPETRAEVRERLEPLRDDCSTAVSCALARIAVAQQDLRLARVTAEDLTTDLEHIEVLASDTPSLVDGQETVEALVELASLGELELDREHLRQRLTTWTTSLQAEWDRSWAREVLTRLEKQ